MVDFCVVYYQKPVVYIVCVFQCQRGVLCIKLGFIKLCNRCIRPSIYNHFYTDIFLGKPFKYRQIYIVINQNYFLLCFFN